MRFRLNLKVKQEPCVISMNYPTGIQAWIYRRIEEADAEFSKFLHDEGYQHGKRKYKPFTFSSLQIRDFEQRENLLKINSPIIHLEVSMYVDAIAEKFVQGVFLNQELSLSSDGWNVGIFEVTSVDIGNKPNFDSPIRFRAQSPICISKPQHRPNGKLIPKYLSPIELDYDEYFFENLRNTYRSTHPELSEAELEPIFSQPCEIRILSAHKSKLVTLKANTDFPIKVKGYFFDFELSAHPELLKCGYYAGFGINTASGFGCCQALRPRVHLKKN